MVHLLLLRMDHAEVLAHPEPGRARVAALEPAFLLGGKVRHRPLEPGNDRPDGEGTRREDAELRLARDVRVARRVRDLDGTARHIELEIARRMAGGTKVEERDEREGQGHETRGRSDGKRTSRTRSLAWECNCEHSSARHQS